MNVHALDRMTRLESKEQYEEDPFRVQLDNSGDTSAPEWFEFDPPPRKRNRRCK